MRLTVKLLEELEAKQKELAELASQADVLKRRCKKIFEAADSHLSDSGEDSVTKGKYTIDYSVGSGRVSWKDAYISVAGSDAATKLAKDAKPTKKIRIERTKK